MKICEDCIKQDVCKFKEQVEGYENKIDLPNPLEPIIQCKYKRTEPSNWSYTAPWVYDSPTITSGTTAVGNHPDWAAVTWYGNKDCTLTTETLN